MRKFKNNPEFLLQAMQRLHFIQRYWQKKKQKK